MFVLYCHALCLYYIVVYPRLATPFSKPSDLPLHGLFVELALQLKSYAILCNSFKIPAFSLPLLCSWTIRVIVHSIVRQKRACAMHAWILSIFMQPKVTFYKKKAAVIYTEVQKNPQLLKRPNYDFVHTVLNIFFSMLSRNDKLNQNQSQQRSH